MTKDNKLQPATTAIVTGRDNSGALAPALWTSSTWSSSGLEESNKQANALHETGNYSRYANPTVEAFERAVAELENTQAALAFASGMGAVSAVVLALCSTGDHIVAQRNCYAGTLAFLSGPCVRLGIDVTFVDGRNAKEFADAVRPGKTILVMAESPSETISIELCGASCQDRVDGDDGGRPVVQTGLRDVIKPLRAAEILSGWRNTH